MKSREFEFDNEKALSLFDFRLDIDHSPSLIQPSVGCVISFLFLPYCTGVVGVAGLIGCDVVW
jgi:hypothetical protein